MGPIERARDIKLSALEIREELQRWRQVVRSRRRRDGNTIEVVKWNDAIDTMALAAIEWLDERVREERSGHTTNTQKQ